MPSHSRERDRRQARLPSGRPVPDSSGPAGSATTPTAAVDKEPVLAVAPAAVTQQRPLAPSLAMLALLLVAFFFRLLWLDHPSTPSIFDESYYVPAARTILALLQPADSRYATSRPGKDPNPEHPPLAKLLIAGDMRVLGDNAWGWRWASVIAGTLAIAFLFQIGRRVGLSSWTAVLAAFLFAFDNLVFVSSRMAILDIFMLLGMLAGAAWFLRRQPIAAGIAFAFGTLCKEYGAYGPAIMVCYAAARALYQRPDRRELLRRAADIAAMGMVYLAWLLVPLWLLDHVWGTFANPLAHLAHIWTYGTHLTNPAGPTGIASWPWEWLHNDVQINYLTTTVTVCSPPSPPGTPCPKEHIVREFTSIYFRGVLNPYLIAGLPLALGYALARLKRGDNRNALLALVWFALAYLPFIPAAVIDHRITYLYYMLPVVPAIALASAQLFTDRCLPRAVTWCYILAIAYGFAAYFPFVGFHL